MQYDEEQFFVNSYDHQFKVYFVEDIFLVTEQFPRSNKLVVRGFLTHDAVLDYLEYADCDISEYRPKEPWYA